MEQTTLFFLDRVTAIFLNEMLLRYLLIYMWDVVRSELVGCACYDDFE